MSSVCTHRGGSVLTGAGSPRALSVPGEARPASLGDARNPALCFGHPVQLMHEQLKGSALSWKQHSSLPSLFQEKEKNICCLIQD